MSLRTGIMPSHLKGAHVRPVIKKPSLDEGILTITDLCHARLRPVLLLQRDYRLTYLSIISASPTSLLTSQITVSRRPLSKYRMSSCVQWTIRILLLCCFSDMPHDTDYPYPMRIFVFFKVIRPYSIFIRILTKFMETLFLTTLCIRHKTME